MSFRGCHCAGNPALRTFARYLQLLDRRWNQESGYRQLHEVQTGIQNLVSQEEFDSLLRHFARTVLGHIRAASPAARLVLEKSPNHVGCIPLIRRCFPAARFIHLVRDPRGVAASNRAAAAGWGKYWARAGVIGISHDWHRAVLASREASQSGAQVYDLRYEDLLTDPITELQRLFVWLDLPADRRDATQFVEECRIDRLRGEPDDIAKGRADVAPSLRREQFFSRGTAEGWRRDLTCMQIAAIEHETRDLIDALGYERVTGRLQGALAAGWRRALKRLAEGLSWRLKRALESIDHRL